MFILVLAGKFDLFSRTLMKAKAIEFYARYLPSEDLREAFNFLEIIHAPQEVIQTLLDLGTDPNAFDANQTTYLARWYVKHLAKGKVYEHLHQH